MTHIDEFNALHADLVGGEISEAEFRAAAVNRFGYDQTEAVIMSCNHDKTDPSTPT